MLNNYIVVFDFETGSNRASDCEIVQVAAAAMDPQNLSIVDEFESLMRPLRPEKLQNDALLVNKKTREELADAPHPSEVWHSFAKWVSQWNHKGKGDSRSAPVAAGHNIINFDLPIYDRYCRTYKTTRTERNGQVVPAIFNNVWKYDTLLMLSSWFENLPELNKMGLDFLRRYFDIPVSADPRHAHDALRDVRDTSTILVKLMKIQRYYSPKVIWKNGCNPEKVAAEKKRRKGEG